RAREGQRDESAGDGGGERAQSTDVGRTLERKLLGDRGPDWRLARERAAATGHALPRPSVRRSIALISRRVRSKERAHQIRAHPARDEALALVAQQLARPRERPAVRQREARALRVRCGDAEARPGVVAEPFEAAEIEAERRLRVTRGERRE